MGDVKSIPVRRALGRVRTANAEAIGEGDFYFSETETEKRVDGRGVIAMQDSDFYFAVDFDLIRPETLKLCHTLETRFFKAGKEAGKWIKQHEICQALGIPSPELKGREVDE